MTENTENEFTKLENKTIGMNIAMYRKIRNIKALDMAGRLGLKEAAYTKYERGETAITVDFIQKVADIIKIDPVQLMTVSPGNMIENGNYSPNSAVVGNNIEGDFNNQSTSKEQNEAILTLINSQIEMNKKIMELLEKK
jgi:transcriptional regulator with XRE-family HTH domain